jgi:hypothetical protein
MQRTYRQGDRGTSSQQFQQRSSQLQQRSSQPNISNQQLNQQQRIQQAQRQQSFFRGPDNPSQLDGRQRDRDFQSQFDGRQRDSRDFSGDRQFSRNAGDNVRDNFDQRFRDRDNFQDRITGRNDDNWRNRVFNDNRANIDQRRSDFARDDWRRNADRIRDDWRRRDRNDLPFRFGWLDNRRFNNWPVWSPWRYSWWNDRPYFWWGWTPANRLTNWLVFGWNRPYYWDYGPGGNVYYTDNYVYYDNQRYLADDQYYRQVYDLAHSVPTIDASAAARIEWIPLGVFAAGRNENENVQRTLQLAVNKNGVMSGTYYNPQNGQVHPLLGMVDDRTQRAAWAFADGEHQEIVFETSIYNLTEPESTMMVHYGPRADDAEVWHLVRLEQPGGSSGELPAPRTTMNRELP